MKWETLPDSDVWVCNVEWQPQSIWLGYLAREWLGFLPRIGGT